MYKKVLKNKNFIKVYFSTCISAFGDGLDDIAFALILYSVSKSTLVISYVFAIKVVFSFMTIFTGALSDRFNKKKMVFFGEISQAIVLILIVLIQKFYVINTATIIIFTTIQAFLSTWAIPAKNTLSLLTMNKELLIESKSLLSISLQIIQIFSYALSSVFIERCGLFSILLIDSITFAISGILFLTISYEEKKVPYKNFNDLKNDIKYGFSFVKNSKVIIIILILAFGGNVLMAPTEAIMPAYFEKYFESYGYSIFMCTLSVGCIISATVLPKLCKKISEAKMLIAGFGAGAIGTLLLTNVNNTIIPYIAALSIGVSFSLVSILNSNILQKLTPNNLLGRVFSIFKCISYLSSPLGMVASGVLGECIPIKYIFCGCGILMSILTFIGFVYFRKKYFNVLEMREVV